MRYITLLVTTLLAIGTAMAQDRETQKVVEYQLVDRAWEKYRKGPYTNLRIEAVTIKGERRYILSRYYEKMARHMEMQGRAMPIYSFHNHPHISGCMLGPDQLEAVRNIGPGELVRVESPRVIRDKECHGYSEFRGEIILAADEPEPEFFLWVQRTVRRKKDVVRIVDTDDPAAFSTGFWEIQYADFEALFQ